MEVNNDNITSLDNEKIYESVKVFIGPTLEKFAFLGLSLQDVKNICLREIEATKQIYDGKYLYKNFLKKRLKCVFESICSDMLNNADTQVEVMANFVNIKFKNNKDMKHSFFILINLSKLLNYYNVDIEFDLIYRLIQKCPEVKYIFEYIYNSNNELVICESAELIYKNDLIVLGLEVYKVLENKPQKSDNSDADSLKTYLTEASKYTKLSKSDEQDVLSRIAAGDKIARDILIKSNLMLVLKYANSYYSCYSNLANISLMDLIQEGNLALIKAVDSFDYSKGDVFFAYAKHYIGEQMMRYIHSKISPLHTTQRDNVLITKFYKSKKYLTSILDREPSIEEIADMMGISIELVIQLQKVAESYISIEELKESESESFDVNNKDVIAADSLDERLFRNQLQESVKRFIDESNLKDQEKLVLRYQFGIGVEKPYNPTEISRLIGITREGVRQMEQRIIKKIYKKNPEVEKLLGFVSDPKQGQSYLESMRLSLQKTVKKVSK